jgi:DNA mismatch repair ATPase MutL
VYVNGRPVRDRTVLYAIQHFICVRSTGSFPVVVLPGAAGRAVDVNVHPANARFLPRRTLLHSVVVARCASDRYRSS